MNALVSRFKEKEQRLAREKKVTIKVDGEDQEFTIVPMDYRGIFVAMQMSNMESFELADEMATLIEKHTIEVAEAAALAVDMLKESPPRKLLPGDFAATYFGTESALELFLAIRNFTIEANKETEKNTTELAEIAKD